MDEESATQNGEENAPVDAMTGIRHTFRSPSEMEPYELLQRDLAFIAGESSSFDIAKEVISGIMAAEDEDAIFAANDKGPLDIEDFLNRNISIFEVNYFKSAEKYREGTLGFYVVMDAYTDQGDEIKIGTGAPNVVSSIRRGQTLGYIKVDKPWHVRITTKDTANGQLYRLAKAA